MSTKTIEQEREAFEAVISGSPYECDISRFPDDADRYTFPGCYADIKVDLAWWMWQAAIKWKDEQPAKVVPQDKNAERYLFLRTDAGIRDDRPFIAISSAGGISQWTGIHADKQVDDAMSKGA